MKNPVSKVQKSAVVYAISLLFWDITQRRLVVIYGRFGDNLSVLSSRVKRESRLFCPKRCYLTTNLISIPSEKNEDLKDVANCPFRVLFYSLSLCNKLFLFIEDYVYLEHDNVSVDNRLKTFRSILSLNSLNAELNLICHLLELLAHHILHVRGVRVKYLEPQQECFNFKIGHPNVFSHN